MTCFTCLLSFPSWCVSRLLWWTAGWRRPQWQWWVVAEGRRAGRVQDVEVESQTASFSSPWSGTGTRDASSAPAATLSWASTAAPATAKEAWSSARTTTSGEPWWLLLTATYKMLETSWLSSWSPGWCFPLFIFSNQQSTTQRYSVYCHITQRKANNLATEKLEWSNDWSFIKFSAKSFSVNWLIN